MTKRTGTIELVKRSFIEMMKDIGTSIPGHILSFDSDTQLAQIQIGVKKIDRDGQSITPSPLIECPVYFFGGGYSVECQIDEGAEGVVLFSQRCIDGWANTGGVADNPILRFHDFSDAYFLPGLRSSPNKLTSFQNNGIRLRDPSGANYIWLKNDGTAEIKVTTLDVTGEVVVTGDVIASGKSLVNHAHTAGLLVDSVPLPVTGTTGIPV